MEHEGGQVVSLYFVPFILLASNPSPSPSPSPNPNPSQVVSLYFVSFILLASLVMMSLFIGVITTSMESAAEMQRTEKEQGAQLAELQSKYGVSNERIAQYKTIFSFFDADGGGSIDRDEFRFAMRCIDEEMTEVAEM